MADFKKAIAITLINEGNYNPGINMKETYKGIDRGANPHWDGWVIIDAIKEEHPGIKTAEMNRILAANAQLQLDIIGFYKANYWNPLQLDRVTDQQVASNLFDCSVNQGDGIGRRFMQKACNLVIDSVGSKMPPLVVDGAIGVKTLSTINALSAPKLNSAINQLRLDRYEDSHGYDIWGHVWQKRLLKYV
jgi:lysozyme family protein